MTTTTTARTLAYPLESVGFGLIYYDSNGTATSQYYRYFDESSYSVDFTLNVLGMGLPSMLYGEVEELLSDSI